MGIASIAATALLLTTFSLMPAATADSSEEIVDGMSKIETLKPGEVTAASCDSVAGDLEKRGRLEYDEVSGALKFIDADRGD